MPACLLSKYCNRNRQLEFLPVPQYNQARSPTEQEDAEEEVLEELFHNAEEEGGPGEGPEELAAEEEGLPMNLGVQWAQVWWRQQGRNEPILIPTEYYPCKFHFAGPKACGLSSECRWSHDGIFGRAHV